MKYLSLKEIKEYLKNEQVKFSILFEEILQNDCMYYNEYDLLLLSTCKRSIDILDTIAYSAKTYNINTLYPLIRLQIDSCLILRAALIHKDNKKFFEKILDSDFQLREFNNPLDNTPLSERKLAKIITEDYPIFINAYDYCCDFVHFTNQTLNLSIRCVENLTFYIDHSLGNKEQKFRIKIGIKYLKNINKILFELIQKCRIEFPKDKNL